LKERSLPGDGLTIVVKSEPGMAALNLVKRLGNQTEIYEISPNWWSEPQTTTALKRCVGWGECFL